MSKLTRALLSEKAVMIVIIICSVELGIAFTLLLVDFMLRSH